MTRASMLSDVSMSDRKVPAAEIKLFPCKIYHSFQRRDGGVSPSDRGCGVFQGRYPSRIVLRNG